MNRKRIIVKLICMLVLAALAVSVLDHIFAPKYVTENKDGRITREFYETDTPLDVIALGSSTMYSAFSPDYLYEKYGFTSYVRSNASQTLWQSYYLLEDALKTQKPSLVVLDVSFIKYGEEFIEEPSNRKTIESMRDAVAKYGAVKSSMAPEEDILSYYFPILRYHARWKELTLQDLRYAYDSSPVTYDGFIMDFTIPQEQNIYESEPIDEVSFPEKATEYLDRIIDLCAKENIPLLLMKTPTYVNSWHKEFDYKISEMAEKRNVSYVNFDNYAADMGLEVRYDYIDDGSHMNVVGAEKFCDYFGRYLTDNYDLEDHRNGLSSADDKICARWDAAVLRYETDRDAGMQKYEEDKKWMKKEMQP